MFALCDVSTFYAGCETVFRPDLWDKPVVVLSDNNGCVIVRSAEAKTPGVKMDDPWLKQKDLFRHCGVVCFSSNYELYADMGDRVISTLEKLSPRVEVYGIDKALCDLTGVYNCRDLIDFGKEIRATVPQRTYLTVGMGIVRAKTLAKLANYATEKWQWQTGGVMDLPNLERQRKLMSALPVDEVWEIGRRISKKLDAMGIKTVLDLADSDIQFTHKRFNVILGGTVRELRGELCLQLGEFAPTKREIVCFRSFDEYITDCPSMRQAIYSHATRTAEELRSEHRYCRFIFTFVKTSPFAFNKPYYGNSTSIKLLTPTQDSRDIISAAARSLDVIQQAGHHYQKAGVMLGDFFSQGVAQFNLFDDNAPRPGSEQLIAIMDTPNAKEGRGTLYFAGQGIQQQWQVRRTMLSPRYTTRNSDLLRVK